MKVGIGVGGVFEKVRKGGYHLSALCASGDEYDDDFSLDMKLIKYINDMEAAKV